MIIGIDIDEVLSETLDFAIAHHKGKIAGIPIKRDDVKNYYLPDNEIFQDVSQEEAVNFFINAQADENALTQLLPVSGAYETLNRRKRTGHILYAITARGEPVREATEKRIKRHFPEFFKEIIFCNHYRPEHPKQEKEEVCKEKGITIFVEDNPKYARNLAEAGIKTYLLERPRNTSMQELNPLLKKVKSREDIILE